MTRAELLRRLDAAWQTFTESYAGLSEAELLEAGVTGAWSVRDIIAHVTTWEEEALTYLPLILAGGRPPRYSTRYGGIDGFNALMTERKKDLPIAEVLRQRDDVHRRVVELVRRVPEEHVTRETRFRHRLRMDTYSHYPQHMRAITSWRRERSVRAMSADG
jgi:DinB superfamily